MVGPAGLFIAVASAGMPLVGLDYDVDVAGPVAGVHLAQVFVNDGPDPLDVTYAFPLHEQAAVDRVRFRIGERIVEAAIDERAAARETYEQALSRGQLAALTEQERPNLFTQQVGNIPPGETVEVLLHVVQPVPRTDGARELVLPLVAAPRFVPTGAPLDVVSPVLASTSLTVDIDVRLETGIALRDLTLHSHAGEVWHDGSTAHVSVRDVPADRDFVLSWRLGAEQPRSALLVQGAHALLSFEPPASPPADARVPREVLWVIDTSCSMTGLPFEVARDAMLAAIDGMDERDSMGFLAFASGVQALTRHPIPATEENKRRVRAQVLALQPGGGTYLLDGVLEALALPRDPERQRFVVFISDGLVANEKSVLQLVARQAHDAHIFAFGIGQAPNRYLLDDLSRVGNGRTTWVRLEDSADAAVARFLETIDAPMLTEVRVDWRDWQVRDVTPGKAPPLFAGQPVFVTAAVDHVGDEPVQISARAVHGVSAWDLSPTWLPPGRALEVTWARQRIADLERDELFGTDHREEILELSLGHQVLCAYTGFVGVDVDGPRQRAPGHAEEQPQALPEGMDQHFLVYGGEVEAIEVLGRRYTVETESTRRGQVLTRDFLQRIPVGRSYQAAVTLAAGVNRSGVGGTGHAQRLDGLDISDPVSGTFSTNFAFDVLEQVEVLLGGLEPEYGGSGLVSPEPFQRQDVLPARQPQTMFDPRDPRQLGWTGLR